MHRTLSVRLSVCLSVRLVTVAIATSVTCFRQPCGRVVSFVLFTFAGRILQGDQPHKLVKINTTQQQSVSNDMNSIGYSGLIPGHNDDPVTR